MGEVFRADDLKLGQAVALKFLPPDVDRDPARLTQLHSEVRMARVVSHPNVCRVYDIDEIDGHTFLSMEFVDGEDLASLLKRIGRFPEERGLEIARQMCAGLAAAHERGVIHRDFKPANVMLDGSGKVRITDFGLAGAAGEILRAGTPAYMAPEQLAGGEVTARSDIYALGLVLYEVFTGQRALEGRNLAELIRKREQSGIVPPSTLVRDLSPEIDVVIMRCLRPEAADRPSSALTVAVSLPGGDPLAAALAAGETPSPEMVAASGADEAISPLAGALLFSFILAGLLVYAAMADRRLLLAHVPITKSMEVLEDRARELTRVLGYASDTGQSATGLAANGEYLAHVSRTDKGADRWDDLRTGDFPGLRFWYRTSPDLLVPLSRQWRPTTSDPAMVVPGMVTVTLDQGGRLLDFRAVPPRRGSTPPLPRQTNWQPLFAAASLDPAAFTPVAVASVPPTFADERAAWKGRQPGHPDVELHVEGAAFEGRPVFFTVNGPWTPVSEPAPDPPGLAEKIFTGLAGLVTLVMVSATLHLARQNLRAGRGDPRGASKISLLLLVVWIAAWGFGARHYLSPGVEAQRFAGFVGAALLNCGILWLAYVALEPYVRRLWPVILVSWTRVLSGRVRDPRVGRDILVGLAVGVAVALVGLLSGMVPQLLADNPPSIPRSAGVAFLLGGGRTIGAFLGMIPNALANAMLMSFVFVLAHAAVKRAWIAVLITSAVLGVFVLAETVSESLLAAITFGAAFVVPIVATLVLYGLFATALAFLLNQVLNSAPLTLDLSKAYAPTSAWIILVIVAVAAFGLYTARAGRPLFGSILPRD
jgi:serine/threonine-protein kinase